MAQIQFQIDYDSNGKVIITSTIQQIDPGDKVTLVTATPQTALQWGIPSPFAPPADGKLYVLPMASSGSPALGVTTPVDMSKAVAQCGGVDTTGKFTPWGGSGGGFPGGGGTNRSGGGGGRRPSPSRVIIDTRPFLVGRGFPKIVSPDCWFFPFRAVK